MKTGTENSQKNIFVGTWNSQRIFRANSQMKGQFAERRNYKNGSQIGAYHFKQPTKSKGN